jgi:hypothetical protein
MPLKGTEMLKATGPTAKQAPMRPELTNESLETLRFEQLFARDQLRISIASMLAAC